MNVDRADEVMEMYAEDARREAALLNGHHPDDPGPVEPHDDDPQDEGQRPARDDEGADEAPIPLAPHVEVPPFPVDCLPAAVADMVSAVSEATQTDPAMAGTSALAVLAACAGGRCEIEVRAGWREPLCLYVVAIARPGERKSAVQRVMVRPVLDVERSLSQGGEAARLEALTRKEVAASTAERERRAAASADPERRDSALADAIGAAALAESITVPPVPRLVADDVTPEAAASLLAEQGGRLAILSAEGGIFDIIAGRYSRNVNMDLFLKGHAGDTLKVDRKGRAPEYISRPALTLGLMIQPQVLDAIAANRDFRGRGLLARFLYAPLESQVGRRRIAPPPVGIETQQVYEAAVSSLAAGMDGWAGDPAVLTLTNEAQHALIELETRVEPMLAEGGELGSLAEWGAKYVGAVARIAGLIHLAEHGPDHGPTTAVSAETIRRAAKIGNYFKAGAANVFSQMGVSSVVADAMYLLGRIEQLDIAEVSERDIHIASRTRFPTKADLAPALGRLIDHGYLTPLIAPKSTGGRPPSPRYRVRTQLTQHTKGVR